jgi:hypothetical protein
MENTKKLCYWHEIAVEHDKVMKERNLPVLHDNYYVKGCFDCSGDKTYCEYYFVLNRRENSK